MWLSMIIFWKVSSLSFFSARFYGFDPALFDIHTADSTERYESLDTDIIKAEWKEKGHDDLEFFNYDLTI